MTVETAIEASRSCFVVSITRSQREEFKCIHGIPNPKAKNLARPSLTWTLNACVYNQIPTAVITGGFQNFAL